MAQKPAKFLTGDLMRHVVVMSLSASIGLVCMFLVDLADLFFIAQLGDESLTAAVGYAALLLYFTFSITLGLAIAVSALAAQLIGAGKEDEARATATSAILLGVSISLVVATLAWLAAPALLGLLGAKGDTWSSALSYYRIVVPVMPISTFGMMSSFLLRAHGDARRYMTVTIAGAVVNAVLDPILIFWAGWGLEGAAVASFCARTAFAVLAISYVLRHYGGYARPNWTHFKGDLPAILAIAIPAVLTNLATPIGNAITTMYLSPFGDSVMAGYAVIGRLVPLVFCVIFALSGAVGPIIGQNFGAAQYDRVRGTFSRSVLFTGAYTLGAWLLLILTHSLLSEVFNLTREGREMMFWFAWVAAPFFFFNGVLFVSNAAFNNLKRPIWSTFLNWARNTVGVWPFAAAGAAIGGAPGVLIGPFLGSVLVALFGIWLAYRLVEGYASGAVDTTKAWRPSFMRPRAETPYSTSRN